MKTAISVETMRRSDAYTIANLTDSRTLMYRAGEGVFKSHQWKGKTAIVCGCGNNAGDGYVLALLLKEAHIDCTLFLLSEKFSEDGKYYFDKCIEKSVPFVICDENTFFYGYNEIVDCIFGTGFKGEVRGLESTIIGRINESDAFVVSVDINSGLDGDCGIASRCVLSDLTVSVGSYKTGHFLNQARWYIKKLVNCDIGIKIVGETYYVSDCSLLDEEDFDELIFFENFTEFYAYAESLISYPPVSPVEFISDAMELLSDDVYIFGFGDYSIYATPDATYLIKEEYPGKE